MTSGPAPPVCSEVLDCLSRDVAVVLIGGELQRDVFNHMVTLLGGEGTSDEVGGARVGGWGR